MFSTTIPLGDPIDRALRAYFLRFQGAPQPTNWSGIEKYGPQEFVVLRNAYGLLAVYLIRENGKLAFVYEEDWPAALTKSLRPSGRDYTFGDGAARLGPMKKKRTKFDTRVVTAYHEAGHAVASFVLHLVFEGVNIVPDAGANVLGRLYKKLETFRADWLKPDEVDNRIIVNLAGMAAEARFTGRADWSFGSADFDHTFDITARLNDLADEDLGTYIYYLWERANNLLRRPGHWEAVEAVARELLLREDLSYVAVSAIVTPLLRYKCALWRLQTCKPSNDPNFRNKLRSCILRRLRPLSQDPSIQEAINLLDSLPVEPSAYSGAAD